MGAVFEACHLATERRVALKLLWPEMLALEGARERFELEARVSARINSPHVVQVLDAGIDADGGSPFLVMELLEGQTLGVLLGREGRLRPERVAEFSRQVACGLDLAHRCRDDAGRPRPVVHRDLKPDNLFVCRSDHTRGVAAESIKILDFGIAKVVSGTRSITQGLWGTPLYVAPEQLLGHAVSPRTDVWALGLIVYEMLTGRSYWRGAKPGERNLQALFVEILQLDLETPTRRAAEAGANLPEAFDRWLLTCLEREPLGRFASAGDAADALIEALGVQLAVTATRGVRAGPTTEALDNVRASPALAAPWLRERVRAPAPLGFVGRELVLARLDPLLERARQGSGRAVFVTGEAGIGKSVLVQHFLERVRAGGGSMVAVGQCLEQYGSGEVFLPFLDALGALLRGENSDRVAHALRTHAPAWCEQFRASLPIATQPSNQQPVLGGRASLLRELVEALGSLAEHTPVVLLLEDLHWADASSIDVLRLLCRRIERQPLLLIGTFRPEQVPVGNPPLEALLCEMRTAQTCEEITLEPLGEGEIAKYLADRFSPNEFSGALGALIHRKTEGLPLFAIRLVQLLAERGDIEQRVSGWSLRVPVSALELEVPPSLQSLIRGRLASLPELDQRLLRNASVLGDEFDSNALASISGLDELEVEDRLVDLERVQRLLSLVGPCELPDGGASTQFRFAHVLYQNVTYDDLGPQRKASLHGRAGECLLNRYGQRAGDVASQLAFHFERSRRFPLAVQYAIDAADRADCLHANIEALQLYSRAIELIDKLPPRARPALRLIAHYKRGWAHQRLSRRDFAIADFERVALEARAPRVNEACAQEQPALDPAFDYFERPWADAFGLRALPQLPPGARVAGPLAFEFEARRAMLDTYRGSISTSQYELSLGTLGALANASENLAWKAEALAYLGAFLDQTGCMQEALACLEEAVELARNHRAERALKCALGYRARVRLGLSLFELALQDYAEAEALSSEAYFLQMSAQQSCLVNGHLGRVDEALSDWARAERIAKQLGRDLPANTVSWLWAELGHADRAVELDRATLRLVQSAREPNQELQLMTLVQLGLTLVKVGDRQPAWALLSDAEALESTRETWPPWCKRPPVAGLRGALLLAEGRAEEAEACFRNMLQRIDRDGCRQVCAAGRLQLAQALALRGDLPAAVTELEAGVELTRGFAMPFITWKVQAELARMCSSLGHQNAARGANAEARTALLGIVESIHDAPLRDRFLSTPAVHEVLVQEQRDSR
jgi:tetratricopeptide (TPR) repeat protein